MAKRKEPRKDREKPTLRTLSSDELNAATGGYGIPGTLKSSSGGGGTSQ